MNEHTPGGVGQPIIRSPGRQAIPFPHLAPPPMRPQEPADLRQQGAVRVQPIHALHGGTLLGAEMIILTTALATATMLPGKNWIGPTSLMHLACLEAGLWGALTGASGPIFTAVRVPAALPLDTALVDQVAHALDRTGLPAGLLEIDLGPVYLADHNTAALPALHALRDLGVGLALTDVGHMPMPQQRLHRLELTCLRLHGCMVAHLDRSHDARRALAATVSAAHDHGMTVVATELQTGVQRDVLADLGCDAAQGKLFGPSMDAASFRAALSRPRLLSS